MAGTLIGCAMFPTTSGIFTNKFEFIEPPSGYSRNTLDTIYKNAQNSLFIFGVNCKQKINKIKMVLRMTGNQKIKTFFVI